MHSSLMKQDPPPAYRRGRPREYAQTPPERGGVPTGTILPYGGATAPLGYLLCNGASYQIADYPALWDAIGNAFGGSKPNFTVPNLQGVFPMGHSGSFAIGATGGSTTISTSQLPSHNHSATSSSSSTLNDAANVLVDAGGTFYGFGGSTGVAFEVNNSSLTVSTSTTTSIGNTGSGSAYLQPYQVVNYIIKT